MLPAPGLPAAPCHRLCRTLPPSPSAKHPLLRKLVRFGCAWSAGAGCADAVAVVLADSASSLPAPARWHSAVSDGRRGAGDGCVCVGLGCSAAGSHQGCSCQPPLLYLRVLWRPAWPREAWCCTVLLPRCLNASGGDRRKHCLQVLQGLTLLLGFAQKGCQ